MEFPFKQLFVGSIRHLLDAKNRLTIPARWRFEGDEGEVYLAVKHPRGYIAVLPPKEVEKIYTQVAQKKLHDDDAQDFLNVFFANAISFGCDKQGRVNLPEDFLQHAGIDREVVLVGAMSKFSIWSPARWAETTQRTSGGNMSDLMKKIDI